MSEQIELVQDKDYGNLEKVEKYLDHCSLFLPSTLAEWSNHLSLPDRVAWVANNVSKYLPENISEENRPKLPAGLDREALERIEAVKQKLIRNKIRSGIYF